MAENNVLVYPGGLHGYMIEFGAAADNVDDNE